MEQFNMVRVALNPEYAAANTDYRECTAIESILGQTHNTVLLIDVTGAENAAQSIFAVVQKIRCSGHDYLMPVFLTADVPNTEAYIDGCALSTAEMLAIAKKIKETIKNVDVIKNGQELGLRFITYVYSRKDTKPHIVPTVCIESKNLYEYEAVRLFINAGGYDSDSFAFINKLRDKKLIVNEQLIDRIRVCPYCSSGHTNYVDFCPVCDSIDFEQKKMLHCFTCGNVAPEEEYRNAMALICPKCNARLRHIGSDYDRPLESYVCNKCFELFIDPVVAAVCLDCGKKIATDRLITKQIYSMTLSDAGEAAVIRGRIDLGADIFNQSRHLDINYFCHLLGWMVNLRRRYSDEIFSLVCIRIDKLLESENYLGIMQLEKTFDELGTRIRDMLRDTDLTTNSGTNVFWILLPRTPLSGGQILTSRLKGLEKLVNSDNRRYISIAAKCFDIFDDVKDEGKITEQLLKEYEKSF